MKNERKTRKGKTFTKTFRILLCLVITMGFVGKVSGSNSHLTFTVFATREGLVGGETANTHIIEPHDHFVALPSRKALCSLDGHEFEVRVTYQGKSITAPVWDVGPWNIHDNYWEAEENRDIYTFLTHGGQPGLPVHEPEAQAAYENGYNDGYGEPVPGHSDGHYIAKPAGIDLADGTFWDDLGMTDNDWVIVEFLWTGNEFYVPDDYPTIQAAIDDCSDGDTIIVRNGTYTGNGNRDIDFNGKAITLRSENGPENCIIDCQGTASAQQQGFCFNSDEDNNSVLDGFTITNGYTLEGGAIYCYGSSPLITNCTIINNVATWIFDSGGGVYCNYASPTIKNCTITGNIGYIGGGIYSWGSPVIIDCNISGNYASEGGGILCKTGTPLIKNSIISGNMAYRGAGIYSVSNPTITNCTIVGNWAPRCVYDSDGGGGIYCNGSSPTISNCILWGNIACRGPQILVNYSTPAVEYSDIQGGWIGDGNIDVDPLFANPGYWDLNGTPSNPDDDFWVNGDYHLKSQAGRWDPTISAWTSDAVTSRCIDAGNPGFSLGDEPISVNNTRINLGAYGGTAQASKTPANWSLSGDLTNDGVVQFDDLFHQIMDWLFIADQQSGDLNRDGKVDFADFALLVKDWLSQTNWYQP